MRAKIILAILLLATAPTVEAQVSVGIGIAVPGVNIGINLGGYPSLARVPGYPVYYAPQVAGNFFFYDGLYWVYAQDGWYASSWYNGPWDPVNADLVPYFVLRVPVRYYRQPPPYFRGWPARSPPRWGEHWGSEWEQHHGGWNQWKRASAPRAAPAPVYQRPYSGDRYPQGEQQHEVRRQNYPYQPREPISRQHYQQGAAAAQPQGSAPQPQGNGKGRGQQGQRPDDKHQDGRQGPGGNSGHNPGQDGDR